MNMSTLRRPLPLLALCLVSGICAAQTIPATAESRFQLLDGNADGIVSKDEYVGDVVFDTLDTDDNNRITAAELQEALGQQRDGEPSAADRIRTADFNTDGELSEEELRRADEMHFQTLDTNQDGNLELAEMKSGFGRR